ncbi:MAG: hypothetical protein M0Z95_04405 [Actinomycetota bacterium]|nr:hypothetical protein [Actinomycetota bacterium]
MTKSVFGSDRDPLAAATWGDRDSGFEDDDEEWFCELHGDDPELCRAYDEQAAEMGFEMHFTKALADALLGDDGGDNR